MKTPLIATLFVALALASPMAVAADAAPAPNSVEGQKLDSGLGELPHYRLWADATGKNVVPRSAQAAKSQRTAQAPIAAPNTTELAALK